MRSRTFVFQRFICRDKQIKKHFRRKANEIQSTRKSNFISCNKTVWLSTFTYQTNNQNVLNYKLIIWLFIRFIRRRWRRLPQQPNRRAAFRELNLVLALNFWTATCKSSGMLTWMELSSAYQPEWLTTNTWLSELVVPMAALRWLVPTSRWLITKLIPISFTQLITTFLRNHRFTMFSVFFARAQLSRTWRASCEFDIRSLLYIRLCALELIVKMAAM